MTYKLLIRQEFFWFLFGLKCGTIKVAGPRQQLLQNSRVLSPSIPPFPLSGQVIEPMYTLY